MLQQYYDSIQSDLEKVKIKKTKKLKKKKVKTVENKFFLEKLLRFTVLSLNNQGVVFLKKKKFALAI